MSSIGGLYLTEESSPVLTFPSEESHSHNWLHRQKWPLGKVCEPSIPSPDLQGFFSFLFSVLPHPDTCTSSPLSWKLFLEEGSPSSPCMSWAWPLVALEVSPLCLLRAPRSAPLEESEGKPANVIWEGDSFNSAQDHPFLIPWMSESRGNERIPVWGIDLCKGPAWRQNSVLSSLREANAPRQDQTFRSWPHAHYSWLYYYLLQMEDMASFAPPETLGIRQYIPEMMRFTTSSWYANKCKCGTSYP